MLFAPNIAWRDYPLRQKVQAILGDEDVLIVVENDANAAGWAEFRFGAARDVDDMLMLTVGTGLGGAIVSNGELVRGAWGVAAEVGHMRVVPGGHYCGCGHEGCWEQYASGSALVRDAQATVIIQPERAARLLELAGGDVDKLTGPQVTQAAQEGDPLAVELLTELGRWLGRGRGVGDRPAGPGAHRRRRWRRGRRGPAPRARAQRLRRAALGPWAPAGGEDRRGVDGQRRGHGRRGRPRASLTGVPVRRRPGRSDDGAGVVVVGVPTVRASATRARRSPTTNTTAAACTSAAGASRHATSTTSRKIGMPAAANHAMVSSGSPPSTGPGSGGTKCASASTRGLGVVVLRRAVPVAPAELGLRGGSAAGRTTRRSATQGATGNDSPALGSRAGAGVSGSGGSSVPSYPSSSPSWATIAAHASSSVGAA